MIVHYYHHIFLIFSQTAHKYITYFSHWINWSTSLSLVHLSQIKASSSESPSGFLPFLGQGLAEPLPFWHCFGILNNAHHAKINVKRSRNGCRTSQQIPQIRKWNIHLKESLVSRGQTAFSMALIDWKL